jgi:flagellar biosynthetic protein FlhB
VSDAHDRTEHPTPRRLERARLEGRLPRSPLAATALAASLLVVPVVAGLNAIAQWIALFRETTRMAAEPVSSMNAALHAWSGWSSGTAVVATAGVAAVVAAVGASAATGALGLSPAALKPALSRLSLRLGIGQLVGLHTSQHAASATLTIALIAWAAAPTVRALLELAATGGLLASDVMGLIDILRATWLRVALVLLLLAVGEIWWSRKRAMASLRMTPREVREERAEIEGRPEIRARRRAHATRKARNVQVGAIRAATAVVVNPAHVAVALRYAPPSIDVPVVVARGADLAALIVRSVASLYDVPIVESPELARALYARLTVGQAIPEDCYAAVAAIFAWLMRTRGVLAGGDGAFPQP